MCILNLFESFSIVSQENIFFRPMSIIIEYFSFTGFSFQIFKVKFSKMYLGFIPIRYGTTADMKMILMEEEVYAYRSIETEGMPCCTGSHREGPGVVRRKTE